MSESPLGFPGGTRFTIRLRHEGEKAGKTIRPVSDFPSPRDQDPARNVKLPTRVERVLVVPDGQRDRDSAEGSERLLSRDRSPC